MVGWLITCVIYTIIFMMSSKFDGIQAIAAGVMCGTVSIAVIKLFGMDKKE